jgi:hypothetical protein
MKGILGEQLLILATAKMKQQVGRVDGLCIVTCDFSIRQLSSDFKVMLRTILFFYFPVENNQRRFF